MQIKLSFYLMYPSYFEEYEISEVAWDFQAHVKHEKNKFFKVSHFFASYELSTIFLSCQKVSRPKRNFKYDLWCSCEDKLQPCMKTFPNFKHVFLSFSFPSLVLSLGSYLSQILIYSKTFNSFKQGIGWAFKKYGNHNLTKLAIEPENCRSPHIMIT